MANPVKPFVFFFNPHVVNEPVLAGISPALGEIAELFDQLDDGQTDMFYRVHKLIRLSPAVHRSHRPGFDEQQHDAAGECERTGNRRNKMTVSGFNVHAQKVNRLARGREVEARIDKHYYAQDGEGDGDDGFYVH
jgi:hypothetical protein